MTIPDKLVEAATEALVAAGYTVNGDRFIRIALAAAFAALPDSEAFWYPPMASLHFADGWKAAILNLARMGEP